MYCYSNLFCCYLRK